MTAEAINIQSLSFHYETNQVLRGLDLRVAEGEFVALLGPNGAGKTTLFNILSGILKPQSGSVQIFGQDIRGMKARDKAKQIGVVPQESTANFNYSNLEIVLMGRVVHTSRFGNESEEDIHQAVRAMERTKTEHLAERGFMEISGGEKQRVIIAQVLAQETSILLLDEPTSNLDINYQIEIMQLIQSIKRERNLTVVAIFHDMNLAAQFADRIVLIKEGEILYDNTPEKTFVPENIHKVYNAHVIVEKNPFTGKPLVLPLYDHHKELESAAEIDKKKIHIISGNGSGSHLFSILAWEGHSLSASIVSSFDVDHRTAESLGIREVHLAFDCIKDAAMVRLLREALKNSDAVVITRLFFTEGNIQLLTEMSDDFDTLKAVYIIDPEGIGARDLTGGKAEELYKKLTEKGAVPVENEEMLTMMLRK